MSVGECGALTLVYLHSPPSILPRARPPACPLPFVTPPRRSSGVVPNLAGSTYPTTPGKPDPLASGGVGVTADFVASTNVVTPTPSASVTFGLAGEVGVDALAKHAAEKRSGAPTPTPGTQPLALAARGSTTRFILVSCASLHPPRLPPAGYLLVSSASDASPPLLWPPIFILPHPVWEDAHAEAGKQCGRAVPRVGSISAQCAAVPGGSPPTEVSAVGARWRHHTSAARVGPIGVALRVGEVVAVQFSMGGLAIGLRRATMARQESASRAAARTIGSAAPM